MPYKKVPVPVPAGSRWCFGCSRVLPLDAYPPDRRNPEGRATRCRCCRRRSQAERRKINRILDDAAERIEAAYARQAPERDWSDLLPLWQRNRPGNCLPATARTPSSRLR